MDESSDAQMLSFVPITSYQNESVTEVSSYSGIGGCGANGPPNDITLAIIRIPLISANSTEVFYGISPPGKTGSHRVAMATIISMPTKRRYARDLSASLIGLNNP